MNVFNDIILNKVVMNTTITSQAVPVVNMYGFAIQAVYTATPSGTLKLQASADPFNYASPVQPPVPTNWTDVTDSSEPVSGAGVFIWNVTGVFYNYVRVVYTDSSGGTSTAVLTVTINGKGV